MCGVVWCGGFRNYLYIIRYWRLGFDRAANREIAGSARTD